MTDVFADGKEREEICCVKCGNMLGWFGDGSNCDLICPRCKQAMELITTNEGFVVRKKRKNLKGLTPVKP